MAEQAVADVDKDVLDLVAFLRAPNSNAQVRRPCLRCVLAFVVVKQAVRVTAAAQVKQAAAQIVEGLSGSQDGIDKLAPAVASLLPALLSVAPAEGGASGPALTALVNLSQVNSLQTAMQKHVSRCDEHMLLSSVCHHPP